MQRRIYTEPLTGVQLTGVQPLLDYPIRTEPPEGYPYQFYAKGGVEDWLLKTGTKCVLDAQGALVPTLLESLGSVKTAKELYQLADLLDDTQIEDLDCFFVPKGSSLTEAIYVFIGSGSGSTFYYGPVSRPLGG
jgi:hypothetical protein